ncbi:lipid A 3-O-deacylase (PagL) superfamily, partial [Striga asiatica]
PSRAAAVGAGIGSDRSTHAEEDGQSPGRHAALWNRAHGLGCLGVAGGEEEEAMRLRGQHQKGRRPRACQCWRFFLGGGQGFPLKRPELRPSATRWGLGSEEQPSLNLGILLFMMGRDQRGEGMGRKCKSQN